jgi:hypothetical protein
MVLAGTPSFSVGTQSPGQVVSDGRRLEVSVQSHLELTLRKPPIHLSCCGPVQPPVWESLVIMKEV